MLEVIKYINENPGILVGLLIWDLLWRGLALWLSARQSQKVWFVLLLVINSMSVVPLVYLIFVSKEKFWKKRSTILEAEVVKKKKK